MSSPLDVEPQLSRILKTDVSDTHFGPILNAVVRGTTTSPLAASYLLNLLTSSDDNFALSTHIQNLALDHTFLLPHLTSLLLSISHSRSQRDTFLAEFTYSLSDLSRSLYGQLFDPRRCHDQAHIRNYERVNIFRRVYSLYGRKVKPQDGLRLLKQMRSSPSAWASKTISIPIIVQSLMSRLLLSGLCMQVASSRGSVRKGGISYLPRPNEYWLKTVLDRSQDRLRAAWLSKGRSGAASWALA